MRQPYMQLVICGMAMNSPGYPTPSPLVSIVLDNAESGARTDFTAVLHIQGDDRTRLHVGSFEMLLYEFAQMQGDSALPVHLELGWAGEETLKVDGIFIEFQASVKSTYIEYTLKGNGAFSSNSTKQGLAIPAIEGNYQPSQVLEAVLDYVQADSAFDYDIDHDDEVVPISRHAEVTSLFGLVYGAGDQKGLIQQSYCDGSRSAAYGLPGKLPSESYRKAGYSNSQIWNSLGEPVSTTQRSASSYTFSVVDPTFHNRGIIRYKNNSNLTNYVSSEALIWGGLNTNIISISATYNGVTQQLLGSGASVSTGLGIDLTGSLLSTQSNRQNSYAASASEMYAAGNVLNNLNAISTQFNTDIKVTVVGTPYRYEAAQAVRVLVYSGGSLNPITGVYRIMKVTHSITGTGYLTSLTLKRLDMISANGTAAALSGFENGGTVNGERSAALTKNKLNLGKPFQNLLNLMRRGLV